MNQSKFIVFEGIDGAGTTTQSELLHRSMSRYSCLTKEPTNGDLGQLARKIIAETPKDESLPSSLAYLFAGDRHEHLYSKGGIAEALYNDKIVVCDRYIMSSLAYQDDWELVHRLNKHFLRPNLTLLLDISVEVALDRITQRRSVKDYYETKDQLRLIRANYHQVLDDGYSVLGEVVVIDGDRPIDEVHADVLKEVNKLWENNNS